ncbi:DUF2057 domain-containing protein [Vibrio kyushuensis]|uniref:DUF2057 family protein n=1 Tax=Vibrio kyushuensis TaxID=2910249 RepID=UPI003D0AD18C
MKMILPILTLLVSFNLLANEITPASDVEIMAVNGVKISVQPTYQINSGFNQVVIRMTKRLKNGSKRETFISKPYVVSFTTNDDVTIKAPKVNSYSDAEKKFRSGPGWVVGGNDEDLEYTSSLLPGKAGFMPYSDLEGLIESYNNEQQIVLSTDENTPAGQLKKAEMAKEQESIKQLKLWYTKADETQRAEFMKWAADQG